MPKAWTKEEEERLVQAVHDHTRDGKVNWGRVSNALDRSVLAVKTRWWKILEKKRDEGTE